MRGKLCTNFNCSLGLGFGDGLGLWLSSGHLLYTFRGWVRVRVLVYGSGVRGRKVKSRDCALASDLVRAPNIQPRAHARLQYSYWFDKQISWFGFRNVQRKAVSMPGEI